MDLDVILNELSINSPADSIQSARLWMVNLIQTVRAACLSGAKRVLRTYIDLNSILLSENYPIARWRNDPNVDLESRRYFKVLTAQYPPLKDLPVIENKILSQDFFYMGDRATGLGVAFLLEGLSISFLSEPEWDRSKIEGIDMQWLEDDGSLVSELIQVNHASRPQHIDETAEWIKKRLRPGIQSGEDLWNRKEELFPSLTFCENIGKEIGSLSSGNPLLRQVAKRLFEIEDYCREWETGPFDPNAFPFKATGESEATMNKYEKERTFYCPGNLVITFKWHGRITPGAWRIYFEPEKHPGNIYIGYIGPKLPSVDYPT